MIKASFLQKQAAKYRELARAEVSLEMRRQLFALASRCDELAAMMTRWPGPKEIAAAAAPSSKAPRPKLATAKAAPKSAPSLKAASIKPASPKPASPKPAAAGEPAHDAPRGPAGAPLPFGEGPRARLVHGFAE